MTHPFSPELIAKLIRYFKEKHNQDISEETAVEYLRAMVKFFGAFAKSREERR